MAKMFYSLEEASAKLGVSESQVKEMALAGKLQQFRDRDKLMFKREQIDALASGGITDESGSPIPTVDSSDTDAISLESDAKMPSAPEDARSLTGISVFDADDAGKSSQGNLTESSAEEEELVLETVGSGSGLLDLTRESDDTSLGAELLDEIYPGSGEGSDAKLEDAPPSSDLFDPSAEAASPSAAFGQLDSSPAEAAAGAGAVRTMYQAESSDPAGSGLVGGLSIGMGVVLVIGLIVMISGLMGVPLQMTKTLSATTSDLLIYMLAIPLVACIIFGAVGFFIGKKIA